MIESEIESTTSAPVEALSATPTELVTTALTVDEGTTVEPTSSANINPKRLYISNVSYQTTEDDLKELLKDYEM